jgi:flavoprotein
VCSSDLTANTVAKVVCGIADSMASNIIAQALKSRTKVVVVPTDLKKEIDTLIPSGKKINIKCRKVDLKNANSLGKIRGLKVFSRPMDLRKIL